MENNDKVLEVKDLVISFKTDRGIVHAVRGVSFDLYKGETLCIVGESGSGKSVTNKAIMGISANNAIIENGSIIFEGEDLTRVSEEEFHRIRGHKIGMIFQDPLSALNPVMKVGKQIIEAMMINKDIIKRKYNDLISKELTSYRNNKANTSYNIARLTNEIENNKTWINKLNNFAKDEAKLLKQINLIENKSQKTEKLEIKLSELKDKLNTLNKSREEMILDIKDYSYSLRKSKESNVTKYQNRINKYQANKEFKSPLEKEINDNNIIKNQLHLTVLKEDSFYEFDDNDLISSLSKHNEEIKKYIESYKNEYKLCKKPLKLNLNIAKKKAKKEVNAYKNEIKLEHENKLNTLNESLKAKYDELNEYEKSLSEEKIKAIRDAILFNHYLDKKKEKESKIQKEINISKTVKDEETYKEIPDAKYALLDKEIKEIKKSILEEKQRYVNLTKITKAEAKRMALEVMREVGIPLPERRFYQYPFEFSGGMRQRIVIAIALTANPDILICDEPTTALDVTIQAQILELINRLKKERHLSCIFITHDLGVVANMADRVAVMYAGKIVEYGKATEVFFDPRHPYTWALLSSIPDIDSKEKLEAIPGTPPDMIYPPKGDAFALRSKYAMAIDFKYEPPFFKVSESHYAATWLLYPGAPKVEMPQIVKTRIKNALIEQQNKIKESNEEEI